MPRLRHPLRSLLLALCLTLSFILIRGSGSAPAPSRPHVLLVTLDTTRQDHTSAFGYPRETTPFLNALADTGVRFANAYAASASTAPSHASLFTSLHPPHHLVLKNGTAMEEGLVTLAETLRTRGYQTAGFVSSFVLERRFGFGQGFDVYDDAFASETASIRHQVFEEHPVAGGFDRPSSATTRRALEWVRRARSGDRPLFLFVHYFDAHGPYDPPERLRDRFVGRAATGLQREIALYDAEILAVDESLRELVRGLHHELGGEPLLSVVVGDHGEGLMDHGHMAHGVHLYEEQVRVPLVLQWPERIPGGGVVEQPVEMVDIPPTLLELVGIVPGEGLSGRSLVGSLTGRDPLPPRPVFLFRRHYDGARFGPLWVEGVQLGVRDGPWKYIHGSPVGTAELFNLDRDPEEQVNLVEERPEVKTRLAGLLEGQWKALEPVSSERPPVSPDDAERLRALGYVP